MSAMLISLTAICALVFAGGVMFGVTVKRSGKSRIGDIVDAAMMFALGALIILSIVGGLILWI